MRLTKRELKKLRDNLPTGSYDAIAEKTCLSFATVRAVLFYPDRYNKEVVAEALAIIEKTKQEISSQKEAIKKI
ncbi:hypothetical protein D3C87_720080 [compost metagenome]